MIPLPIWAVTVLIVLTIGSWMLFWVAMFRMIARLGGWRTLAEHYRQERPAPGPRWRRCSITLGRWCGYGGVVTVVASEQGLSLSLPWLFGFGHEPLFIPWSDIQASSHRGYFSSSLRLTAAQVPAVTITLSARLWRTIAAAQPASPMAKLGKPSG